MFPGRPPSRVVGYAPRAMEHLIVSTLVDHGYVAVFLLMALQAACIPIPSEATMALGGAAASGTFVTATLGAGHRPLSLAAVIAAGVTGDLAGAWVAYAIGPLGGGPRGGTVWPRGFPAGDAVGWDRTSI